jgi:hypothetical protein
MMKKKKALYKHPHIVISPCEMGHGIFATKKITADTTLEECPFLRINADACGGILDDYVFNTDCNDGESEPGHYLLVLGWGSLFNHADNHNVEYWHDTERDLIVFHTIKDVPAGKQLFVNYGNDWWQTRDLDPL